jgi:sigma-B regulation protein RsbU (phosphoserine phosphatase)
MSDDAAIRLAVCENEADPVATSGLVDALGVALNQEREARAAARELTDRYEEINLLYSISEIIGSVRSFEDAAARILAEVMDVLSSKRASLWVHHPETGTLVLTAAVGEDGLRGPIPADDIDSATAWVFREKQALNVERAPDPPPGDPRPRLRNGEAFLSVPIHYTPPDGSTRTVGVLTLIGRKSGRRFTTGDERLLSAIASQVGAAIEARRLMEEGLRQERMVREMELAHDLQIKLLPVPEAFEPPPEIAARCQPADSVGGDFYQLYRLSGDRVGLLIGDVSSHGFPAALIMALTMSAIGIYAKEEEAPAEVLRRVHRAVIRELETTEMYLSLFYGVLDAGHGRLAYANAGHPQAYRIDAGGHIIRLGATGPPLGTVAVEPYGERVTSWHPGDLLVLFTDGLSDSLARHLGSFDGETALVQSVRDRRDASVDDIVASIFERSDAHPTSQPDDRTLLLVRG